MLVNTQLRFPSTDRTYVVRLPTEALSNKVIGIVRIPSTSWDILLPNVAEILIRYSVCPLIPSFILGVMANLDCFPSTDFTCNFRLTRSNSSIEH